MKPKLIAATIIHEMPILLFAGVILAIGIDAVHYTITALGWKYASMIWGGLILVIAFFWSWNWLSGWAKRTLLAADMLPEEEWRVM